MNESRQTRLERAQMRVLFNVPFFAPGLMKLPVVFDDSVQTAQTDGINIRWNGKWFDELPDHVLPTVLCHEVCHCLLGHLWRCPADCDWDVWNQATDHAVNNMLKEFAGKTTAKNLADPFPFPDPPEAYLANPAFNGMAEEVVYGILSGQKAPPSGQGQKPPQGQGQSKSGQGQGQPQQGQGNGNGKPQPGSMPSFGQMQKPDPAQGKAPGQPDPKKVQNGWESTLIQCVQASKGRGDVPAGLARFVDGLVNTQVPWYEILRSMLREQCTDDWDFQHPAMEFSDADFILPSMRSEKIGTVVFATDTSGSIDQDMLRHFQAEKQSCLDEMRPAKLVDIYCDSAIHAVREYAAGDEIKKDCPGGGGTDFRPVFERVETFDQIPKCLVYLTDLDGRFPDADPGYPVIWVTWDKDKKAPFGDTIVAQAS